MISRQIYSLTIPAQDGPTVPQVVAVEHVSDHKYYGTGRAAMHRSLPRPIKVLFVKHVVHLKERSFEYARDGHIEDLFFTNGLNFFSQSFSEEWDDFTLQKLSAPITSVAVDHSK